jgi:hypothetical protein
MGGRGSGRPGGAPENLTNAGKGRIKGSHNKFTDLKREVLESYQQRGGVAWLTKLPDNVFFGAIRDLLPKKIEQENTGEIGLVVKIIKSGDGKKDA